jgi:tetratricopeptide (TPR) repeat protein
MKVFVFTLFMVAGCFKTLAQNRIIDSLKDNLKNEKTDSVRAHTLYFLSYYYQRYKPDSALLLAQEAYTLSIQSNYILGQSSSLGQMAGAFNRLGNFPKALEYYIEQLKILEKKGDAADIASAFLNIAVLYNSQKDTEKALYYAYKADSIARRNDLKNLFLYTLLNIGDIFFNNNQVDSALLYTSRCYAEAIKQKHDLITGNSLNNMGNIYFKSAKYKEALTSFKTSMPYVQAMQDYNTLAECNLGLAKTFDQLGMKDSAFYYANNSFQLASANQFLQQALNTSAFLTQLYKQQNHIDSAFAYQQTYIALKDSFDNTEKIKQLQSLTISEQVRQRQLKEQELALVKERRLKLEWLMIGTFIPIFFFISAFLSRKKVHKKLIQISGVFSLLFLFEYITLLIHPMVAKGTGHSPVLEVIIFIAIAAILSPTHHKIEHWLVSKLTQRHHKTLHTPVKPGEHPVKPGKN